TNRPACLCWVSGDGGGVGGSRVGRGGGHGGGTHATDPPPRPPGHPGELSVAALLPALRRRLGLPTELHVVKAPARDSSGLVLLSGCHRATEELQRFFSHQRRRGGFPVTYSAVTVGVPAEAEGEIRVGLCHRQHGDGAVVVPVPCPGRRSVARGEVRSTLTRYQAAGGCGGLRPAPAAAQDGLPRAAAGSPGPAAVPGAGGPRARPPRGQGAGGALPAAPPGHPHASHTGKWP
uniref:RNA pseudouridylate synthase domain-containing protein 3 n=1 Tax=Anas platyrhynchos TaxID=8839 RepID=A0A8B9ZIX7_ANAPL